MAEESSLLLMERRPPSLLTTRSVAPDLKLAAARGPTAAGRRCGSGRARAAREPGRVGGLPRAPPLAEGGEVNDRAADEGRGDLERALAGCDRSRDLVVAGEFGRGDAG